MKNKEELIKKINLGYLTPMQEIKIYKFITAERKRIVTKLLKELDYSHSFIKQIIKREGEINKGEKNIS